MAPMCCHTRAHWRHLANTIEPVLPSAHQSPQSKRQNDRFSHFVQLTAECRRTHWSHLANTIELFAFLGPPKSIIQTANRSVQPFLQSSRQKVLILYSGRPFPPKLPLPMGDLDPHLIYDSLGPSEPTTQTASRSVQPFLHR